MLIFMGMLMLAAFFHDARRVVTDVEQTAENAVEVTEATTDISVATTASPYTDEQKTEILDDFFEHSAIIGDSIVAGYATYAAGSEAPEYIKKMVFLASVGYGTDEALKSAEGSSTHPIYQGQSRPVTESLSLIKPQNIFINLGINELDGVPAARVAERYHQLVENIKQVCPDSNIYAISLTYIAEGKEKEHFTNAGIKEYNSYISSHSEQWGITYLDLASRMADEKGFLKAEYAGDGYVHHNNKGFKVWDKLLEETALKSYEDRKKAENSQTTTLASTDEE